MRSLAAVALAALLVAGCLDDDTVNPADAAGVVPAEDGPPPRQPPATIYLPPEQNDTARDSDSAGNRAPVANLTATATTGAVPFTATVTLAGSDADGDALTWAVDADGDGDIDATGSALPYSFDAAFLTPGSRNLTAWLDDGEVNTTAILQLDVAPYPGETFTFTGTEFSGLNPDGFGQLNPAGIRNHTFTLPFPVASITLELTWEDPDFFGYDLDLYIDPPTGDLITSGATGSNPETVTLTATDLTSQVGDWLLEVEAFQALNVDYTLTVTLQ